MQTNTPDLERPMLLIENPINFIFYLAFMCDSPE
jgi:hypothetical protein